MNEKSNYWREETKKFTWKHARISLIAEYINRHDIHSVLDLGAGEGHLYGMLDHRVKYRGLDIAGEKEGAVRTPQIDFFDFDDISEVTELAEIPFDCVVISGLLEYLEHWELLMKIVNQKWLKPGGICLVSFINSKKYDRDKLLKEHPQWKNRFTFAQIIFDLDRFGFRIDHVYPLFWGSHTIFLPITRLWAQLAKSGDDFSILDNSFVSQYLFITHS